MLNEEKLKELLVTTGSEKILLITKTIDNKGYEVRTYGETEQLITLCVATLHDLLVDNIEIIFPGSFLYKIYEILKKEQHNFKIERGTKE